MSPNIEFPSADSPAVDSPTQYLVRLEEQFAAVTLQWRRAEERVARWSAAAPNDDDAPRDLLLFRAEQFANRLLQQRTQLIKEIQKAQETLAARASPAEDDDDTPFASRRFHRPRYTEAPPPPFAYPGNKHAEEEDDAPDDRVAELRPEIPLLDPPLSGVEIGECMKAHRAEILALPRAVRMLRLAEIVVAKRAGVSPPIEMSAQPPPEQNAAETIPRAA